MEKEKNSAEVIEVIISGKQYRVKRLNLVYLAAMKKLPQEITATIGNLAASDQASVKKDFLRHYRSMVEICKQGLVDPEPSDENLAKISIRDTGILARMLLYGEYTFDALEEVTREVTAAKK